MNTEKTRIRYQERYEKYGQSKETLGWFKGKQDLRYNALIDHLPLSVNSILDIGCGFSDGLDFILKKFPDISYTGVDLVPEFIEVSKMRFPDQNFYCADYTRIHLDGQYDALIASGIFNFNTGRNIQEVIQIFEYTKENRIRYLAFDLLSNNVDYTMPDNFYYDPEEIIAIVKKFSRRFNICHLDQPFEFSVFVDFEDDFNASTSRFKK